MSGEHYYIKYLKSIINGIDSYFTSLFTKEEILLLNKFISLNDVEIILFCRLSQRKYEFSRVNTLFKGIDTNVEIVNNLLRLQIFETIESKTDFNTCWTAVLNCLRSDEISGLLNSFHLKSTGDLPSKLHFLYNSLLTTRTLHGLLKNQFSSHLIKFLSQRNKLNNNASELEKLVRINPNLLILLRRALRILQFTCNTAGVSSGEAVSSYAPLNIDITLLVAIDKIKFPEYSISHCEPSLLNTFFPSINHFHLWEASNELKVLFYKAKSIDSIRAGHLHNNNNNNNNNTFKYNYQLIKKITIFSELILTESKMIYSNGHLKSENFIPKLLSLSNENILSYTEVATLVIQNCLVNYIAQYDLPVSELHIPCHINAGNILASACWEAVSYFESEQSRNYRLAIHLLLSLLVCPYAQHRRGRYYLRLLIDIKNYRLQEKEINNNNSHNHDQDWLVNAENEMSILYLICNLALSDKMIKNAEVLDFKLRKNAIILKFSKIKKIDDEIKAKNILESISSNLNLNFVENLVGSISETLKNYILMPLPSTQNWNCKACTYLNENNHTSCVMCMTSKPDMSCQKESNLENNNNIPNESKRTKSGGEIDDLSDKISFTDEINQDEFNFVMSSNDSVNHLNLINQNFSPPTAVLTGKRLGLIVKKKSKRKKEDEHLYNDSSENNHQAIISKKRNINNNDTSAGTVLRPGKSKFVNVEGDIVTVEDLVKDRLYERNLDLYHKLTKNTILDCKELLNADEVSDLEFHKASRGGGWQGWNCEGAPIRSLFTLLLWHILFPVSGTATEVLLNNEEVSFPSCFVTGAFLTPYQDAPLDLESPQFYTNRKNIIESFFEWLKTSSVKQIIKLIGIRYRKHYRTSCRGMDWRIKLQCLQAIACCLGGDKLVVLLRALCIDYKHLSGGMPDLLLLRVEGKFDKDNDNDNDNDNDTANIKLLNLSEWIGLNWESLYKPEHLKNQSYHSDIYSLKDPNTHVNNTQNLPEDSGDVKENVSNDDVIQPSSLDANSKDDIILESDLFSPEDFFASGQHLIANDENLIEIVGSSDRIESRTRLNVTMECVFVEVKGPTDTLSYRQHIWLQIMNEGGIDAWICKISEE